ncbi:ATP-binding cassette domain-containing protein [Jannaschia sp. LMIT008]|uniref:ATP-binding cassette domain-containing protein n=1 Tax=Jannaschia maritima TaxID=3032585 RepID=UPI00281182C3|nr:ATP-binding cassette domain-containing protein [Jannaschia sp. LMIT008]
MRPSEGAIPLLQARALRLERGAAVPVNGVDLTLPGGGVTALMGPNGAGKSMLLHLLHGLIPPTDGHVLWRGRPLDRLGRRAQAMVFQSPVLLRRSVAANVDFALRSRGVRDAGLRDGLLERVGLAGLGRRPARALSGGEAQRLALARALAVAPDLLLLDEATGRLDPASVAMIEAVLIAERAQGTTILMVTHDVAQARRLADSIVVMDAGRIVGDGPARRFLDAGPRAVPPPETGMRRR